MAKTVIKEMIITLLILLAIILVLCILFYDYNPATKVIPDKVAYTTPENVKEELSKSEGVDQSQYDIVLSLDSTDLNNYRTVNDYVPGKQNPFSSYKTTTQGSSGGNINNGTNSGNNTSSNTQNGYFQNKGTK